MNVKRPTTPPPSSAAVSSADNTTPSAGAQPVSDEKKRAFRQICHEGYSIATALLDQREIEKQKKTQTSSSGEMRSYKDEQGTTIYGHGTIAHIPKGGGLISFAGPFGRGYI